MRFAHPLWLLGMLVAVVVAAGLVAGGVLLLKALRRFGDDSRMRELVTSRPASRRALKGGLVVAAVALVFVGVAQPQYGRGTRHIPATNLDVVIVLDFSKSMFARDVPPSRIQRAQSDVARLIASLPGVRFGAVAFAGEPMSFPLTSDGGAIAQFFRQLGPHDMPVGGTAIGRALEAGRALLDRDPASKKHRRMLVLVTDGEDLEGDPVSVAQAAHDSGIGIHVVQIGGRTPEAIPDVDPSGSFLGWRKDEDGHPLTTSLTADGEAQLAKIAEIGGGRIVRSEQGATGIEEVAEMLRRLMSEELSEKVETVYADVFAYPVGLAALLLVIEAFLPETGRRAKATVVPPPRKKKRRPARKKRAWAQAAAASIVLAWLLPLLSACESDAPDLDRLFQRKAPGVQKAIHALDAGDAGAAASLLEEYLSTGKCEGGNIGTPPIVRERSNASFDLGLALFRVGERFGKRFGEEGAGKPAPEEEQALANRSLEIDCALRVVRVIAEDRDVPVDLRARAQYLSGNLDFLRREYKTAVDSYDAALRLIPGQPGDAGDSLGRDAAWNRSIALRRIEEEKPPDAGPDSKPPPSDAGDKKNEGGSGDKDDPKKDQKPDGGSPPEPSGQPSSEPSAQPSAAPSSAPSAAPSGEPSEKEQAPPKDQPSLGQDQRMLDQLEEAPTMQQEAAKRGARAARGMEDK